MSRDQVDLIVIGICLVTFIAMMLMLLFNSDPAGLYG